MPFDQAYKDAKDAIDDFNKKYEKTPFGPAGTSAANGLDYFAKAAEAFRTGNTEGGSAAIVRGLGAMAGIFALAGPEGAAFGAVMGAITGLISAIMSLFQPAADSLETKLEKFISEQDLADARERLSAQKDDWKLVEIEIAGLVAQQTGVTWEWLNRNVNWQPHFDNIDFAFNKLADNRRKNLSGWMPLFDITITYALRFWLNVECMAGLVANGPQALSPSGKEDDTFAKMRTSIASTFFKHILNIYYDSLNEVDLYALWLSGSGHYYDWEEGGSNVPYGSVNDGALQHRIGVINTVPLEDWGGDMWELSVSANGTLFIAAGEDGLWVGRGREGNWHRVGDFYCFHVAIGEMPHGEVVVACLIGDGRTIAYSAFNDDPDPSKWSWGPWDSRDLPDVNMNVLALGVQPKPTEWSLYAFVMTGGGSGGFYEVGLSAGSNIAALTELTPTWYASEQLTEEFYGVDLSGRLQGPTTFSCVGDTLFFHVGRTVYVLDKTGWTTWPLRQYLESVIGRPAFQVWQARAFADGTFVVSTNRGLVMRRPDPLSNWEPSDTLDKDAQTIWFWKGVSRQAHTVQALLELLKGPGGLAPLGT